MTITSSPDASAFVTLTSNMRTFLIDTADKGYAGVYEVTVNATIPPESPPGVNMSDGFTFLIEVLDPCETTNLNFDPPVTNMLAYVNLAADT